MLGNAHLTNFFVNESTPGELNAALRSYTQAEGQLREPNPDLHYNRATAYKFLESYTDALKDFRRANELDPGLNANADIEWIETFLTQVSTKLSSQCGLKPKKVANLVRQLPTTLNSHPFAQNYAFKRVQEMTDFANAGSILVCKIVMKLSKDVSETPARFIAVDSSGTFFILSFYNASPNAHAELTNFATAFIRDPFRIRVRATLNDHVSITQLLEYFCVRVGDPNMVLVDNKTIEGTATQSVLVNKPV